MFFMIIIKFMIKQGAHTSFQPDGLSDVEIKVLRANLAERFKCRRLLRFYEERDGAAIPRVPVHLHEKLLAQLSLLLRRNGFHELKATKSNNLKRMKGPYKDYFSIRLNRDHRIVFRWDDDESGAREIRHTAKKDLR